MSRAAQIDRHIDREESRLVEAFNRGDIGREEYNREMRALQQEAREAYQADCDEALERVNGDWGVW